MTALADLPAAALEQLAPSNLPRTYRRGQVLGNEGDPGESISILKKGQLRVTQWTAGHDPGSKSARRVHELMTRFPLIMHRVPKSGIAPGRWRLAYNAATVSWNRPAPVSNARFRPGVARAEGGALWSAC